MFSGTKLKSVLGHPFDAAGTDFYSFNELKKLSSMGGDPHPHAFTEHLADWRWTASYKSLSKKESFKKSKNELERWLRVPLLFAPPEKEKALPLNPPTVSELRFVSWNINRGRALDLILKCFDEDPVFKFADILMLNEVDVGFARSGNRNVFVDLAKHLGFYGVYSTGYLTLTLGAGQDLRAEGKNLIGSQGNVILSRYPIKEVARIGLPLLRKRFGLREHQLGTDSALGIRIALPSGQDVVALVLHVEVFTCREERAQVVAHVLSEAEKYFPQNAFWVLGGDFNTGAISLRSKTAFLGDLIKFYCTGRKPWREPVKHEPLFKFLKSKGFLLEELRDLKRPTSIYTPRFLTERQKLSEFFPQGVIKVLEKMFLDREGHFKLYLDWLLARPNDAKSWSLEENHPSSPVWPSISDHLPVGFLAKLQAI